MWTGSPRARWRPLRAERWAPSCVSALPRRRHCAPRSTSYAFGAVHAPTTRSAPPWTTRLRRSPLSTPANSPGSTRPKATSSPPVRCTAPPMSSSRSVSWRPPAPRVPRTIYSCRNGANDYFLSSSSVCEGKTRISVIGGLYVDRPNQPSLPVYRCLVPGSHHFATNDDACEGQTTEYLLGYSLSYWHLVRYVNGGAPYDRVGFVGAGPRPLPGRVEPRDPAQDGPRRGDHPDLDLQRRGVRRPFQLHRSGVRGDHEGVQRGLWWTGA